MSGGEKKLLDLSAQLEELLAQRDARISALEKAQAEMSGELDEVLGAVQRLTYERDHLRRALDWVAEASGLKAGADPQAVVSHVEQLARGGREQA